MANADVMKTTKLVIPDSYLPKVFTKISENAVIPSLIPSEPQLYNNTDMIYLDGEPVTQYVQPVEGGTKEATDGSFGTKPMHKFKIQTTIRMTEDMLFANEDNSATDDQLDIIFDKMDASLGAGVDAGMIHQFDPHTQGTVTDAATIALAKVGTPITATDDLLADVDSLPDPLIANRYNPTGIALDTLYANELRKFRNNDGVKMFPEIPMTVNTLGSFEGMNAVVSGNVSGRSFKGLEETGIRAIIGQWDKARWGIIRDIALRRFDVGDPDNRGYDLAYKNEVAFRVEMIFAFGLVDEKAFAVLKGDPIKTASIAAKSTKAIKAE